jgi:hypothetical protein
MMSADGRWVASTGMMPGARPRATMSRLQPFGTLVDLTLLLDHKMRKITPGLGWPVYLVPIYEVAY